ncbi:hypothetical protein DPEC_G00339300 [Dallia pectoralis]|uniref:Uncharacterized protein n=1 Tax=Dallia pectoralis TaxID=75939 RepID=A0ACC2F4X6_DALPE|nr:hypothetical protein DPEC_G00339300 [Dallia pectoralis]
MKLPSQSPHLNLIELLSEQLDCMTGMTAFLRLSPAWSAETGRVKRQQPPVNPSAFHRCPKKAALSGALICSLASAGLEMLWLCALQAEKRSTI